MLKYFYICAMKKYIYIGVACLLVALLGIITLQSGRIKKFKQELIKTNATIEAYSNENYVLKKNNKTFMLTIDELNSLNDSLIVKINDVRKELNIKDKEIKRLGYLASTASKSDTIRFKDTLFVNKFKDADTTITDNGWYKCNIKLRYPNEISINPTFKSEKYVLTSLKREPINKPKKTCIGRFFQKKHDVVTVDVVEKNPFIITDKERFITIID